MDEEQLKQIFGDVAKPALAMYTEARADQSPDAAWIDIMSDLVFRMPAIRLAEGQVRQGAPVWMYRFDWESPAFGGVLGAAHAMDIPFVFNTLDVGLSRMFTGDSPGRQKLSDLMHASWAAFISSGNPAAPSCQPGRPTIWTGAPPLSGAPLRTWSIIRRGRYERCGRRCSRSERVAHEQRKQW